MSFIPVKLGTSDPASSKANHSDSLHFAPASRTILLSQSSKVVNRGAHGNGFDFGDVTDDLEGLHEMPLRIRSFALGNRVFLCNGDDNLALVPQAFRSVHMPMAMNPVPAK
jgi:hypothetical protein